MVLDTCTHSVDCLAQCSAPAGLGKYLDPGLQTKCAQWPPSPQARVAQQLVRGGAETGKLAGLWLRLRCRRCGSERRSTTLVIPRSPATRDRTIVPRLGPPLGAWAAALAVLGTQGRPATAPCGRRGAAPNMANHCAKPKTHFQKERTSAAACGTAKRGSRRRGSEENPAWLGEEGVTWVNCDL